MGKVDVRFNFKPHQLRAMESETRFEVRVWARRSGKTFFAIARQVMRCLQAPSKDWRGYYLAPTRIQAKSITWDYLEAWLSGVPGIVFNQAELRVDFPNGSRLQLLGAEQYNSLRGRYADDICLDETAHIPMSAWTQVLSPMIADRGGRATFMGTANGRQNALYQLYQYAMTANDPEWSADVQDVYQVNMLTPKEIARLKRQLTEAEFGAEMLCKWDAATRGAYYAKDMAAAMEAGRITTVAYDKMLPVVAAVDLGWSDAMAVGFFQQAGNQHRCLLAKAYEHTAIPDMIGDWRGLGFPVSKVILPHDAKVTELGTGKTRQQVFHEMGCNTLIAPNQRIHEGISQVRDLLPHMWYDADNTQDLREALNSYRSEFDEVNGVHRMTPKHDWSSHWADMVRYYAVGRPANNRNAGPRPALVGTI